MKTDKTHTRSSLLLLLCIAIITMLVASGCQKKNELDDNAQQCKLLKRSTGNIDYLLSNAALYNCPDVVKSLIDSGANVNNWSTQGFPLLIAILRDNKEVEKILLNAGADVNAVVPPFEKASGLTSLMIVAGTNMFMVRLYSFKNYDDFDENDMRLTLLNAAKRLIELGANVNAEAPNGYTPLILSIAERNCDIANLLIENDANPNVTDPNGTPALILTISGSCSDLAPALIKAGADVNVKDESGSTPLILAIKNHRYNTSAATNDLISALLNAGANVNAKDGNGESVLSLACKQNQPALVNRMLDANADPNTADINGRTPLMIASENGKTDIMRTLIERGANINATDINGNTALMLAVGSAQEESVRLLIDSGADVNIKNKAGRSALHHPRLTILDQLTAAGAK